MQIEAKLEALGLVLPGPPKVPPGFQFSFAWTRVRGNHVYVSGHAPQAADGSFTGPFGKVPSEVSLEAAQLAGQDAGEHARIAVGMATLPLNNAVTIAAEVEIAT